MKQGAIILIDDQDSELRILRMCFKEIDPSREVVSFTSAEDAFEYMDNHINDVFMILCDVKMPAMTGHDLLNKINQDHHLRMQAVPFIFLSNSDLPNDVEQSYSLSAQSYFQKPFSINEMTALLREIYTYWSKVLLPNDKHRYVHIERSH